MELYVLVVSFHLIMHVYRGIFRQIFFSTQFVITFFQLFSILLFFFATYCNFSNLFSVLFKQCIRLGFFVIFSQFVIKPCTNYYFFLKPKLFFGGGWAIFQIKKIAIKIRKCFIYFFTTTDKVYYESNSEPIFTCADETPSYLFCLYKAFLSCILCFCFFIIWGPPWP